MADMKLLQPEIFIGAFWAQLTQSQQVLPPSGRVSVVQPLRERNVYALQ